MDQIVSIEMIQRKARSMFALGKGRDDHGMNPMSAAIPTYQAEWDRLDALMRPQARVCAGEVSPP